MELGYTALGNRIRFHRKEKGFTQAFLAKQVGIEPSNISHIERATSTVGLARLVQIANVLGCTADDLLYDSLEHEKDHFNNQLVELTKDCSPEDLRVIVNTLITLKENLQKRDKRHHSK